MGFLSLDFIYFIFRQGKGGRKGGKHQSVASGATPVRDQTHNPSTCPNPELNQRPFSLKEGAQPTEPHHSGLLSSFQFSDFHHCLIVDMREDVLICRKCSIKYLKVIRKPVVNLFSNECRKKMFALQLQLCFKINYVYIHIYIHTHTHEVISYESDLLLPVCSFLVYPSKKIFCNHKHRQFLCHPCISSSSLHPLSSLLSLSNICVSASMCFAGYPGATW